MLKGAAPKLVYSKVARNAGLTKITKQIAYKSVFAPPAGYTCRAQNPCPATHRMVTDPLYGERITFRYTRDFHGLQDMLGEQSEKKAEGIGENMRKEEENPGRYMGKHHKSHDALTLQKCAALCEGGMSGGRKAVGPWMDSGRHCGAFRVVYGKHPRCEIHATPIRPIVQASSTRKAPLWFEEFLREYLIFSDCM